MSFAAAQFEVLFDNGEPAALQHAAYLPYGGLGFPAPHAERPWVFTNFVQTLDGIASLKGRHASGSDISQSQEDRWLMDLLRAHADAVLYGVGTLIEETAVSRAPGGPVFDLKFDEMMDLRRQLGRRRETNIFVTGSGRLDLREYRVFDGSLVDAAVITTADGAERLAGRAERPQVNVLVCGEGREVDLPQAMRRLRAELGIEYLLCEGGPTLNAAMTKAGLVDERFLTIAPFEAGQEIPPEQERTALDEQQGVSLRPTTLTGLGFRKQQMPRWQWLSCRRVGDHQFHRYRLRRG